MIRVSAGFAVFLTALLSIQTANAQSGDSHAGYHYPPPANSEVYVSQARILPTASKRTRVGFTVGLTARQNSKSYAPQYHLFAKGAHSQKLIIVATGRGNYDTLYRMRGLLAALTAEARTSRFFRDMRSPENVNFFDLVKMLGFTRITVSDGERFAHTINLP